MIKNLIGMGEITQEADVVVIGAGTAGLVIATALARDGLSVVCLESGGWYQETEEHPLNNVVQTKSVYTGATHGRFRCLGGTSTRWGGALIPFLSSDVENANWPISYNQIVQYLRAVEKLFDLPNGPYELNGILPEAGSQHVARLAKWPSFKKRNVFNLLSEEAHAENGPVIWLNATATYFKVENTNLECIIALAPDASRISVHAREVIFAAGAIENTRLLLLLDRQNEACINNTSDQLGRYFYDHLSTVVAELDVIDRKALNRLVGFRFEEGGTMRNLRFELSEASSIRGKVPPCFAHISFAEEQDSGFNALRNLFRYIQQRRIPPFSIFLQLAAFSPWLIRALWWRFAEKRLLFPDRVKIQVHMVVEQTQRRENCISLSPDKVDVFGQPLAQIEWSVHDQDVENLSKAAAAFEETWNSSRLASIAKFSSLQNGEVELQLEQHGGIYHPGGSTRMGETEVSGVVDSHLRLFSVPNVSVVSTSVLPTGGGANPTMMLMMLALRCIENVKNKLSKG